MYLPISRWNTPILSWCLVLLLVLTAGVLLRVSEASIGAWEKRERSYLNTHGIEKLTLYPAHLEPQKTMKLARGALIKIKPDSSADAPQCWLRNENLGPNLLLGGERYDTVLTTSEETPWYRDLALPKARVSLHCEFPGGVSPANFEAQLVRVLGPTFFEVLPAQPHQVSVDSVFPAAVTSDQVR